MELRPSSQSPVRDSDDPIGTPSGFAGDCSATLFRGWARDSFALFFAGWRHVGENLAEVLKRRAPGLLPLIQMCDALSRNALNYRSERCNV